MNVLLLKCGLPHDTVIVCVRPGQYPLKKDDLTFSSPDAAFLLVEVFYYVPNVTHAALSPPQRLPLRLFLSPQPPHNTKASP